MAWNSTVIAVSSAQTAIVTAAMLNGAHIQDPTPAVLMNLAAAGGQTVFLGGTLTTGTGTQGFPLLPQTPMAVTLLRSDPLNGITTGGSVNVALMIGRQ